MKRRKKDRDAAAQWGQLELAIPGISKLIEHRSMDGAIYPEVKKAPKPDSEAAALTVRKGLAL
jgi:hypothetical protein